MELPYTARTKKCQWILVSIKENLQAISARNPIEIFLFFLTAPLSGECDETQKCAHLCLPRINATRVCACSLGYHLQTESNKCVTSKRAVIHYKTTYDIWDHILVTLPPVACCFFLGRTFCSEKTIQYHSYAYNLFTVTNKFYTTFM